MSVTMELNRESVTSSTESLRRSQSRPQTNPLSRYRPLSPKKEIRQPSLTEQPKPRESSSGQHICSVAPKSSLPLVPTSEGLRNAPADQSFKIQPADDALVEQEDSEVVHSNGPIQVGDDTRATISQPEGQIIRPLESGLPDSWSEHDKLGSEGPPATPDTDGLFLRQECERKAVPLLADQDPADEGVADNESSKSSTRSLSDTVPTLLSQSTAASTAPSQTSTCARPIRVSFPAEQDLFVFDSKPESALKLRFNNVMDRLEEPLLKYVHSKKEKFRPISIRLASLGMDESTAKHSIVVFCDDEKVKRVGKFFKKSLAKDLYQPHGSGLPSFEVYVVGSRPRLRLLRMELEAQLPASGLALRDEEETMCGAPISFSKEGAAETLFSTLGGIIKVTDMDGFHKWFGITAGHLLNDWAKDDDDNSDSSSLFSLEDDDPGASEPASQQSSTSTPRQDAERRRSAWAMDDYQTLDVSLYTPHDALINGRYLDWSILEVNEPKRNLLPRDMNAHGKADLVLPIIGALPRPISAMMVTASRPPKRGILSDETSRLIMRPGSKFVQTFMLSPNDDLNMIGDGDSGSWVVDPVTRVVYGHAVASDALGDIYVIPILDTLEDIETSMGWQSVNLPTSADIALARSLLGLPRSSSTQPQRIEPSGPWNIDKKLKLDNVDHIREDAPREDSDDGLQGRSQQALRLRARELPGSNSPHPRVTGGFHPNASHTPYDQSPESWATGVTLVELGENNKAPDPTEGFSNGEHTPGPQTPRDVQTQSKFRDLVDASSSNCPSDGAHVITDPLTHFLGCLGVDQRQGYLDSLSEPVKHDIMTELRRLDSMLRQLGHDIEDHDLSLYCQQSLASWRHSPQYKKGLSRAHTKPTTGGDLVSWPRQPSPAEFSTVTNTKVPRQLTVTDLVDAFVIQFEKTAAGEYVPVNEPEVDKRFRGRFPNQRVTLTNLLQSVDHDNILDARRSPGRLRYFHIPANNMQWLEEAIARYYSERSPNAQKSGVQSQFSSQTELLLRNQAWRGRQLGNVASRHMRPFCDNLSTNSMLSDPIARSMVLFSPYLDLESARKHAKTGELISAGPHKLSSFEDENLFLEEATARRGPVRKPSRLTDKQLGKTKASELIGRAKVLKWTAQSSRGRVVVPNPLGQALMDAARVYEALSIYRDKLMLNRYLNNEPPMHPRRTLDQSYNWALSTTAALDRQQVLYRYTDKAKSRQAFRSGGNTALSVRPDTPMGDDMLEARSKTPTTLEANLPNLIMVDQLWMWILDDNTIITCFPQSSNDDIHKTIRDRLETSYSSLTSAYDLGLIIVEECTKAVFEKSVDGKDQGRKFTDVFAETVGRTTKRQTILYRQFWHWTEAASETFKQKKSDMEELQVALLDIKQEGKVQAEARDIIDELSIILNIVKTQLRLVNDYSRQVEHILDPQGHFADAYSSFNWSSGGRPPPPAEVGKHHRHSRSEDPDRAAQFDAFRMKAYKVLNQLSERVEEVTRLKATAETTSNALNELLSLKQQQAGVVQAWQAVKQGDEATKQSQAIMVFSVVTIIFLPLSFIATFFGMNSVDFDPHNGDSVFDRFPHILAISTILVSLTILFAVSGATRRISLALSRVAANWLLVYTGLYRLWVTLRTNLDLQGFLDSTEDNMREMRESIRNQVRKGKQDRSATRVGSSGIKATGRRLSRPWKGAGQGRLTSASEDGTWDASTCVSIDST